MDRELSKAEQMEEKRKWDDKFFNLAEAPVKRWMANFLKKDVNEVFDDYHDFDDLFVTSSTDINKVKYAFYLSDKQPNEESKINKDIILNDDNFKKAMSVVFDSVFAVFPSIVKTMVKYSSEFENVFPEFDNNNYCFIFKYVDRLEFEKTKLLNILYQIRDERKKLEENKDSIPISKYTEINEKLNEMYKSHFKKLTEISDDDIKKQKEKNKILNDILNKDNNKDNYRLYMCCKLASDMKNDVVFDRLPKISSSVSTYTDVD